MYPHKVHAVSEGALDRVHLGQSHCVWVDM